MLIVAFIIEILIMIGVPIVLWSYLTKRFNLTMNLVWAGAITFILSQVVHLPLNYVLGLLRGGKGVALWPLPAMALVAGLSAGVCEELARYLALKFWKKEARSWEEGITFGAGHGGMESLILGLLVFSTSINMLIMKSGGLERLGLSGEDFLRLKSQVEAFWSVPWYVPLLGGLERIFAITMHLAWTLLVLQSIVRSNILWLFYAILGHTLVDGIAVFMKMKVYSTILMETVVFIFALFALWVIIKLRKPVERPTREIQ
ncbi:MAG: YhfC family glutamic-type intramembrane protease [candidate division WOR-3 bacterium]